MIEKVADFYELNKILREEILTQTSLPNDHVLNGLSVSGADLEKRLEEEIFVPFKIDDSFIVFELSPRDSSSDITQTIDDKLNFVSSFTFKLTIYGKSSSMVAKIIKSRFESEEVRHSLFDKGVYIEQITNSQPFNEFINNTMWLRSDVAIEISCETEIDKVTDPFEFENLGELHVGPPFDEVEPPVPPEEWSAYITIYLTEQTGKNFTIYSNNYQYGVDWGDGNINNDNTHEYENYGEYIIKVKGRLEVEIEWGEFGGDLKYGALVSYSTKDTQGYAVTRVECLEPIVGDCAFAYCSSLYEVILSEEQTSIPDLCFYKSGITGLTSIQGIENIQRIGSSAFENCSLLASFTVPSTVREIQSGAFIGIGLSLEEPIIVTISGDEDIPIDLSGSRIFESANLAELYLPKKISEIGSRFLYNNPDTVDIYYPGTYNEFESIPKNENWAGSNVEVHYTIN